jgi:hypothetical protein
MITNFVLGFVGIVLSYFGETGGNPQAVIIGRTILVVLNLQTLSLFVNK